MKKLVLLGLLFFISSEAEQTFSKQKIKVGKIKLTVEIADTDEKRAQGLMNRKKLEADSGMLFIFPDERPRGFWMKNTFVPLSIGYFDKSMRLKKIIDMEPQPGVADFDLTVYSSEFPAQYALEMPKGWFKEKKIKAAQDGKDGDKLELLSK